MPFEPIPLSPYKKPSAQAKPLFPENYVDMVATCLKNTTNAHDHKDATPVPFIAHRTDFPVYITADGCEKGSPFFERGGLDQMIDVNEPYPLNSVNVHFAIQGTVSDHLAGKWSANKYTIYAPLIEALQENGLPETLFTADTAFVSTDKRLRLPGAHVIEDVDSATMGADFIKTAKDGHTLMARDVNLKNKDSVLRQLDALNDRWKPKISQTLITMRDKVVNNAFSEVDMNALRDVVGANLLRSAPDFYFAEKKTEGFIPVEEGQRLARIINAAHPMDKFEVKSGLHGGTAGHEIRHPELLTKSELMQIAEADNVHPAIKSAAENWANSDIHQRLRLTAITAKMRENNMIIKTHYPDQNSMITGDTYTYQRAYVSLAHFLRKNNNVEADKYGLISSDDAEQIFKNHLTHAERQTVIQHVQTLESLFGGPDAKKHTEALVEKLTDMHKSACVQEMCDNAKKSEMERRSASLKNP